MEGLDNFQMDDELMKMIMMQMYGKLDMEKWTGGMVNNDTTQWD